jgi:hypothetical protein
MQYLRRFFITKRWETIFSASSVAPTSLIRTVARLELIRKEGTLEVLIYMISRYNAQKNLQYLHFSDRYHYTTHASVTKLNEDFHTFEPSITLHPQTMTKLAILYVIFPPLIEPEISLPCSQDPATSEILCNNSNRLLFHDEEFLTTRPTRKLEDPSYTQKLLFTQLNAHRIGKNLTNLYILSNKQTNKNKLTVKSEVSTSLISKHLTEHDPDTSITIIILIITISLNYILYFLSL